MLEHAHAERQTVTFLERPILPEGSTVTSASVVAFTRWNRILVMVDDWGGLDLPGSLVRDWETPEEAVRRGTKEEVRVLIWPPQLASVMQTDGGFMLSYVASLRWVGKPYAEQADAQHMRRQFLDVGEALRVSHSREVLFEIVRRASMVFPLVQGGRHPPTFSRVVRNF